MCVCLCTCTSASVLSLLSLPLAPADRGGDSAEEGGAPREDWAQRRLCGGTEMFGQQLNSRSHYITQN